MQNPMVWIDTETGGVDPRRHALLQVAMIINTQGKETVEYSWNIRPTMNREIDESALKVNNLSREAIAQYPSAEQVKREMESVLGKYVDKFNRSSKFVVGGYNVGFDMDFLRDFWSNQGDQYFGSWFSAYPVDVFKILCHYRYLGILGMRHLPNMQLSTMCNFFGIELSDAHDALADIRATRALYHRIAELVKIEEVAVTL